MNAATNFKPLGLGSGSPLSDQPFGQEVGPGTARGNSLRPLTYRSHPHLIKIAVLRITLRTQLNDPYSLSYSEFRQPQTN
jgi:hypothetical protein